MREGVQASLLGLGGAGCEPLVWGLERLGIKIPTWIAFGVVVVSAALILLTLVVCSHMAVAWLRQRGRGKLGQWLMGTVGATFILIGIGAITYASVWFHPTSATADGLNWNPPTPTSPPNVDNRGGIII